jgi:hypothetical protein
MQGCGRESLSFPHCSKTTSSFRKMQHIERKIQTRNLVNAEANKLYSLINEALADKVGEKVIKFTPHKTWTVKIRKIIDDIISESESNGFRIWFQFGLDWVWLCIDKTYKTSEASVGYVKQDVFLCNLDGDIFVADDRKTCELRTDYTLDEFVSVQAEIRELEEKLSALKNQVRELTV